MRIYRIAKARHARNAQMMLNGEGAREWGGRFNFPGIRTVYCASTLSLAALEVLVHAPRVAILPEYRFLEVEVPDHAIELLTDEDLALDAATVGNERLGPSGTLGFSIVSFVLPLERNVVLNPDHPDFASLVTHGDVEPFGIDERLVRQECDKSATRTGATKDPAHATPETGKPEYRDGEIPWFPKVDLRRSVSEGRCSWAGGGPGAVRTECCQHPRSKPRDVQVVVEIPWALRMLTLGLHFERGRENAQAFSIAPVRARRCHMRRA